MYYIGMDIHKKIISCCIKTATGEIVDEGTIAANRIALKERFKKGNA